MLLNLFGRKHIKTSTDLELAEMVRTGDKRALGELFNRYNFKIYGVCLKYMKGAEPSKDLLMHIFEILPRKIVKSEIKNFGGWLYQLSKNECLMELRKKKNYLEDIESIQIAGISEDLNLAVLNETQLAIMENTIPQLKEEQKICIELFYLKEKSYKEIEYLTGFDLKKIKSHIQNGKRNLKLILEQKPEFIERFR